MTPGRDAVIAVLAQLAARRATEVESAVLELYADDLIADGALFEDIDAVCTRVGKAPRALHETAFPDVGTLLVACRARRRAVLAQQQIAGAPEPLALPGPSMTHTRAGIWLQRIKHAARYGDVTGAARRFPLPEDDDVGRAE